MKISYYAIIMLLIFGLFLSGCTDSNISTDLKNSSLIDSNINQVQNEEQTPPAEAILACEGKNVNDVCTFENNNETLNGVCNEKDEIFSCAPEREQNENMNTDEKQVTQNTKIENILNTEEFDSCIYNTKDNPECKDCCDCLSDVDGESRTACRDICATHDFSENSDFITITAPSVLGVEGNYSECVDKASSSECKSCCEDSMDLQCGDYRHCRTACNNFFGDPK